MDTLREIWERSSWKTTSWDYARLPSHAFDVRSRLRKSNRVTVVVVTVIALFAFVNLSYLSSSEDRILPPSTTYLQRGTFAPIALPGYTNTGSIEQRTCNDLQHNGTIGAQKSWTLEDDIMQIALSLDALPIVKYRESVIRNPNLSVETVVDHLWARLSGSSIWLPEHGVYLVITRVIFLGEKQILTVPKVSFLRGQIFDEDWQHLEGHNVTLAGKQITFPTVFNIPTDYEDGERDGYGPEDPRIVLEEGVKSGEPIIIFNMIHRRSDWKRAMYIFRPFTNQIQILTIKDQTRKEIEKNWEPFFLSQTAYQSSTGFYGQESEHLHFVYSYNPLLILKCHLRCGDCEIAFAQQPVPRFTSDRIPDERASLSGGTQFVPLPLSKRSGVHPDVQAFVGFARTQVNDDCGKKGETKFYRPELVVMVYFQGHFHLSYASRALDFGSTFIDLSSTDDPCEKGKFLLPYSISQWDLVEDVMTVTFSVDDSTVQVARFQGVLSLVRGLPQWDGVLRGGGPLDDKNREMTKLLSSWTGDNVRMCSVQSAINYTLTAGQLHDALFTNPNKPVEINPSMELSWKAKHDALESAKRPP